MFCGPLGWGGAEAETGWVFNQNDVILISKRICVENF